MKLAKIGNYLGDKEVGWDSDYLGDNIKIETIKILKNKG